MTFKPILAGSVIVPRGSTFDNDIREKMKLPNPQYQKYSAGFVKWNGAPPPRKYTPHHKIDRKSVAFPVAAAKYVEGLEDHRTKGETIAAGIDVVPRFNQTEALDALQKNDYSGSIIVPCGGGKTTTALMAIARAQVTTIILVHTRELQRQWVERINQQMSGVVVTQYGGGKKDISGDIVVATVQTLARMNFWEVFDLTARFGMVVMDEAHRAPASTFTEVLLAIPAAKRIGLTATPDRKDKQTDLMYWSIAPEVYRTTNQEMFESGATVPPDVEMIPTGFRIPPIMYAVYASGSQVATGLNREDAEALAHEHGGFFEADDSWNAILAACSNNTLRTSKCVDEIVRLADDGRLILALSDRIEHIKDVTVMLKNRGVKAVALHGSVPHSEREDIIRSANDGELQVIVGSTVADEGLDIKRLDAGILLLPTANVRKLKQRQGRIMRAAAGKRVPVWLHMYDYGLENIAASAVKTYKSIGVTNIKWNK